MREERLVKQNETLVRLARSEELAAGQWMEMLGEVTEVAARALETERTSVWPSWPQRSILPTSRPCVRSIRSRLMTLETTRGPRSLRRAI